MDFYKIKERSLKKGVIEVYPDFKVCKSKDLMVRGKSFYAIWDPDKGMWSTDEYDVQRIVDAELMAYREKMTTDEKVVVRTLGDFSSKAWLDFKTYVKNVSDCSRQLDNKLTFSNTEVKKSDYVSKRLPYPLEKGDISAYEEIISTLYSPEERAKIEWAIGSIVAGDSKDIQKFLVFYGEAGTGKSTIINIIQKLFDGYYTTFEAKALTSSSNAFSTEVFKTNPLVGIQHDGDLSKIEDNTKLNSIVSHEEMTMNEKYKASYTARTNCFLFMATNRPVKITDAKSGIIRRLIDVSPTGKKIPPKRFFNLINQIDFELGGIAYHCLEVYRKMGKNYYSSYRPVNMILQTDVFYNFVESCYDLFKKNDSTTLTASYELYKRYCDDSLVEYKLARYKFREELKNYFRTFYDVTRVDGKQVRSYYEGFLYDKFSIIQEPVKEEHPSSLVLDSTESIFDEVYANCPAQLATAEGSPRKKWENVNTVLSDINTHKLHYVKIPENHIVIDFDIKDENGEKSFEKNVEAASKWPPTYAELSKSEKGVHLHYIYDGDVNTLSRIYDDNIEVKVFSGNSSLRRKLTKCNNIPIAHINSGLPLKKGDKSVVNLDTLKNEKQLRALIERNLNKEIHPNTAPSVSFIYKLLEDAYSSEMHYDVSDLQPRIYAFAAKSTHQAENCLKMCSQMKFKSDDVSDPMTPVNDELIFFDVEVFPNLFVVVWKSENGRPVKMINPTSTDIEDLIKYKLVGFNCRRYDNHILYARLLGYSNEQLFDISQRIIAGHNNAMFSEAYNISYTDVYDFSSKKQSLKKFEIELGIHHQELGLRWDEEVPKDLWDKVADYCVNDVVATQATFEARKQDFIAREILADISGLTVNDTSNQHTAKIIFGADKHPQSKFVYTDLSTIFPGYKFERGKSSYRGEDPGEGGYVYAEPGMYGNVALLDIASMHPTSLIQLNLFGDEYTANFKQLLDIRLFIKHKEYDKVKELFDGKLSKYLTSDDQAKALSYALKIVINSVYGLTSAKFDNKFRDPRNVDNIVAKRGALFMIDLKHAVQEKGFKVAHIKTDSIKIPDATNEIIQFVMDFGKKYGYNFEHEATYDKMCLVNDAVYIAKYNSSKTINGDHADQWTATGAQFQQPYVFKTLFSKEPIEFKDLCETKTVTTALYLDMNEGLPDVSLFEKEYDKLRKASASQEKLKELQDKIAKGHNYIFVGKAGAFSPILPGNGGGLLVREKDGKYYSATGAKGYRWMESEMVKSLGLESKIDKSYYTSLVDEAVDTITQYGDFEWFTSSSPYLSIISDVLPF